MIRIVHNSAVTLLVASFGFMVAAVVARQTTGFESWSGAMAATYLWNFALAVAHLLVGRSVGRLIAARRIDTNGN